MEKRVTWFQAFVSISERILDIPWFSNEAWWFHLSGYGNSQKKTLVCGLLKIPFHPHQTQLHDHKACVYCVWCILGCAS